MTAAERPPGGLGSTGREDQAPNSREVILDAAEQLMSTRGYAQTSIAAIRRESGLPVGSIYHHFANKAGILAGVLERWSGRFFAEVPVYGCGAGDPHSRFAAYWTGAVEAMVNQHATFLLECDLTRLGHREPDLAAALRQLRDASQRRLEPVYLAYARDCGVLDAGELAARLAVLTECSARGLILTCGPDLAALRRAMDDLGLAIRSTVAASAPSG